MNTHILLFISLAILFAACQPTKETEPIPTLTFDHTPDQVIDLQDYVEPLEIIPLESRKHLGRYKFSIFLNESFFLFEDDIPFRIRRYNYQGKLLLDMNRYGRGPGEHQWIAAMDIDTFNQRIVVADARSNEIHLYTFQGEHLVTYALPAMAVADIMTIDRNRFLIIKKPVISPYVPKKQGNYKLLRVARIQNDSLVLEKEMLTYEPTTFLNIGNGKLFYRYKNQIRIKPPLEPYIYKYAHGQLTPVARMTFTSPQTLPENYFKTLDFESVVGFGKFIENKPYAYHLSALIENNKLLLFNYDVKNNSYFGVSFKEKAVTRTGRYLKLPTSQNDIGIKLAIFPYIRMTDRFIYNVVHPRIIQKMNADSFRELLQQYPQLQTALEKNQNVLIRSQIK